MCKNFVASYNGGLPCDQSANPTCWCNQTEPKKHSIAEFSNVERHES